MSDSPSRSTSNGLSKVLSKTRRRHKRNSDSASNSIISTESDSKKGLRQSLESVVDKSKGNGSDNEQESKGIQKLASTLGSKRRRKKKEREDELRATEEAERGRSVAERGTLENENESRSLSRSLANRSGDGSSLITYDSDTES
jgi:hypothetical protein